MFYNIEKIEINEQLIVTTDRLTLKLANLNRFR